MDLILWRHADAEDGTPDLARRLTAKGAKQARAMAQWLRPHLPKDARILVSPAERARQTAAALREHFDVVQALAPGASGESVLAVAGWPDAEDTVLLVGHQPTLGEAVARVLSGKSTSWSIRKGGIWWLSNRVRDDAEQVVLKAVMSPDLL
jgi:phosphohistidine phosphatase